jgi:hypothetical protein
VGHPAIGPEGRGVQKASHHTCAERQESGKGIQIPNASHLPVISILESGPIVKKILEHLDLWDTRNHDPPAEDDSNTPELVYDDSDSQIPQYDYWE